MLINLFLYSFLLSSIIARISLALCLPSGSGKACTNTRLHGANGETLSSAKANLNGDTLWRLSLTLEKSGQKKVEASARIRFVDDRNYEPPQGRIFVEDDYQGLIRVNDKGYTGIWTLSEDKNDRKDGLWICKLNIFITNLIT
jgi:hypothetical protein